MKWPFGKDLETRAESSYGDAVIAALVGKAPRASALAGASLNCRPWRRAAVLVGRAFAACRS